MNRDAVLAVLHGHIPDLLAVYAFGSRVHTVARPDSDLDLAVLVAGYADAALLWETAALLADTVRCPVDLLDFRAASTVMQHQILTGGERWWAIDGRAALYEAGVPSEKTELDAARAGLIADIRRRGTIYGR